MTSSHTPKHPDRGSRGWCTCPRQPSVPSCSDSERSVSTCPHCPRQPLAPQTSLRWSTPGASCRRTPETQRVEFATREMILGTHLPTPRPVQILLARDHTGRVVAQEIEVFGDNHLEGVDHLGAPGQHLLHPDHGVGGGHRTPTLLTETLLHLQGGVLLNQVLGGLVLDGVHQANPSLRSKLGDLRKVR